MMPHEETSMGDVIDFPNPDSSAAQADGTVVRAVAERIDQIPPQTDRDDAVDGVEVPDTGNPTAEPMQRGPRIPPALAGKAREVATSAGRSVVRHGAYTLGGAWVLGGRAMHRLSQHDITEAIRQARAKGDYGAVAELEQRKRESATDRWQRILLQLKVTGIVAAATPTVVIGINLLVLLYAAGAWMLPGGANFTSVWTNGFWAFEQDVAGLLAWLFSWWPWMLTGGAAAVGYVLWRTGRDQELAPAWANDPNAAKPGEVVNITPSIVVAALRNLGISALRKAVDDAEDAGAWMLGLITQYGPGAQVHVKLPPQVNTEDVRKRRDTLAGNLDRAAHEVLIEPDPGSEREFTLWVAHSGALDRPVPASPLLDEEFGPVDIYRDTMPWGLSPKGDPVELNLLQQHLLLPGLSKQGKTAAARALALWAALDPSVRFRIADLKGFGDWSMFKELAETLIEGAGAENFIATCDMLEDGVAEMERRYEAWRSMGKKGDVDRASSQPGSGFEPLILIVDEAQKLYGCTTEHPDGGDIGGKGKRSRAVRAAQAIHDQGRAVNIHLWHFAQNPTDANLPVVVREGAMIRASLFVGTESIARMALGDAPVDTGAEPHALRAGLDRGTVVLAPGESMDLPSGATHTTVRTHFISTEQAYDVIERAQKFRAGVQRRTDTGLQRDLLDDLAEVYEPDEERAKDTDLVVRLRKLAGQNYPPYRNLTGTKLRGQLDDEHQVTAKQRDGYWFIRSQDVHTARAAREVSGT